MKIYGVLLLFFFSTSIAGLRAQTIEIDSLEAKLTPLSKGMKGYCSVKELNENLILWKEILTLAEGLASFDQLFEKAKYTIQFGENKVVPRASRRNSYKTTLSRFYFAAGQIYLSDMYCPERAKDYFKKTIVLSAHNNELDSLLSLDLPCIHTETKEQNSGTERNDSSMVEEENLKKSRRKRNQVNRENRRKINRKSRTDDRKDDRLRAMDHKDRQKSARKSFRKFQRQRKKSVEGYLLGSDKLILDRPGILYRRVLIYKTSNFKGIRKVKIKRRILSKKENKIEKRNKYMRFNYIETIKNREESTRNKEHKSYFYRRWFD